MTYRLPRLSLSRFRAAVLTLFVALPTVSRAQGPGEWVPGGTGGWLNWALLMGVFGVIWLLFYKGLYPLFLRHYPPSFCKFLFWSLFLLYALAWLHLSLYVLFDIGFYYAWARWTAVFLSVLWLIWFVVVFLRRRPA